MRLRVIPIQFLFALPHFIPVPVYHDGETIKYDTLTHDETEAVIKGEFTRYARQRRPPPHKCHSRTAHGGKLCRERV